MYFIVKTTGTVNARGIFNTHSSQQKSSVWLRLSLNTKLVFDVLKYESNFLILQMRSDRLICFKPDSSATLTLPLSYFWSSTH